MKLTIFYQQPKQRPDSSPAVEPASGDFADLAEAKRIAMTSVSPGNIHGHCAGFEIWNEAGETVASWKRDHA